MFRIVLRVVSVIQIVLGLAYLFAPAGFLRLIGHSAPPADLAYPLGMLSARFIVYGLGLWIASANPAKHIAWIRLMALIQAIDLGVGVYYTALGVVSLSVSAPAMFNALWIGLCLAFLRPRTEASI